MTFRKGVLSGASLKDRDLRAAFLAKGTRTKAQRPEPNGRGSVAVSDAKGSICERF